MNCFVESIMQNTHMPLSLTHRHILTSNSVNIFVAVPKGQYSYAQFASMSPINWINIIFSRRTMLPVSYQTIYHLINLSPLALQQTGDEVWSHS